MSDNVVHVHFRPSDRWPQRQVWCCIECGSRHFKVARYLAEGDDPDAEGDDLRIECANCENLQRGFTLAYAPV